MILKTEPHRRNLIVSAKEKPGISKMPDFSLAKLYNQNRNNLYSQNADRSDNTIDESVNQKYYRHKLSE